jgi:hypothetical protein
MGEFRVASETSSRTEISQDIRYSLNAEYISKFILFHELLPPCLVYEIKSPWNISLIQTLLICCLVNKFLAFWEGQRVYNSSLRDAFLNLCTFLHHAPLNPISLLSSYLPGLKFACFQKGFLTTIRVNLSFTCTFSTSLWSLQEQVLRLEYRFRNPHYLTFSVI